MYVIKRDGRKENVYFDKITSRIQKLCYNLNMNFIDPIKITMKVMDGIYEGITTVELDNLAASQAAYLSTSHPDYSTLAARIAISNLQKETKKNFSDVISDLYHYINPKTKQHNPIISKETYDIVVQNKDKLNSAIIYNRDFNYDYFGFKTLERSYLLKINGKIAERPQHMLMRVGVGIWGENIEKVIETYQLMSEKYFTHATPSLFNSGTVNPQFCSCFLVSIKDDSLSGIFDTMKDCATLSKHAGGIGLNIHKIRSSGTYIAGTNGTSNGIIPMLRVFNNISTYIDQGGNKRPGSNAIYLEVWHPDIEAFLDLKKNTGNEELRCRDLFLALWVCDLFMKRVENDEDWSLFCPHETMEDGKRLEDLYGQEFEERYLRYEREGKVKKIIKAQKLWEKIIESHVETGIPYLCYKDAFNRKNNQKNLGTLKSSNLCAEIGIYSSSEETGTCVLASIGLPTFIHNYKFNFSKLKEVAKVITRNLDKIIDINYYPIPEAKRSSLRHRPIGIGIQGLADVFAILKLPFTSEEAKKLNQEIAETIYYGALEASCELAEKYGPYETYHGSPISKGLLQFDLWDVKPNKWDWQELKNKIQKYGVRNSLLTCMMPTASTSQILGYNECFEPFTSNIYQRKTLSGEFQVVNKYLLKDLIDLNIWTPELKNKIIANQGSIQNIDEIPKDIQELYKTVWEIKQKDIIDMAADRGAFIDQSQSMNIYFAEPSYKKLSSMHFYGWKKGLKTGMYYLRTRPAADALQFTITPKNEKEKNNEKNKEKEDEILACSILNKEACEMCSA